MQCSREHRKSRVSPPLVSLPASGESQLYTPLTFGDVAGEHSPALKGRYAMRETGAELSPSKAVRLCGRRARLFGSSSSGGVSLWARGDSLSFSGLLRCNSVWQCPVCAPRIMQDRAEALRMLWERHAESSGAVLLITLTAPHEYGNDLKPLRRHVSGAWRRVVSGAPWVRWKAKHKVLGFVRALEVTHGLNGWHPHLHALIYFEGKAPPLAEVQSWFFSRWASAFTQGTAWPAPSREHGVRVSAPKAGDYLAKMGLAAELALSHTKEGRKVNRTPWQILRDLTNRKGDRAALARDTRLWSEWANAMKGARQLTVSRELRLRYPHAQQLELELEAQTELPESGAEEVASWSPAEWEDIARADVRGTWRVAALSLWRYPRALWRTLLVRWECELLGLPYPDAANVGDIYRQTSPPLEDRAAA